MVVPSKSFSMLTQSRWRVQVATPVQAARADQLCFPHLPDVLAMCTVLSQGQHPHPFAGRSKTEQGAVDAASAHWPPVPV